MYVIFMDWVLRSLPPHARVRMKTKTIRNITYKIPLARPRRVGTDGAGSGYPVLEDDPIHVI